MGEQTVNRRLGIKCIQRTVWLIHSFDTRRRWHVPSRPQENLLEVKLHVNNWPPRQPVRALQQLVASRNPTDTGQEPSLFVRSGDTRKAQSCWSGNCHSSVWSVRLLRTSRPTCVSRVQPSWLSRKPAKPTLSDSLRTPTCALSTPRESPSCPKISSLPDVSVARELRFSFVSWQTQNGRFHGHQNL